MLARLRGRLTYANVVSTLCLFIVLGGGAYAANEWNGSNIQDETLTAADVKGQNGTSSVKGTNGSITSAEVSGQPAFPSTGQPYVDGSLTTWDLKDSAVQGRDVLDNTLLGADIDENSLGPVPSVGFGGVDTNALQTGAVTRSKLAEPEKWHYIGDPGEPAFENGWTNYDAAVNHKDATWQHASYMKDSSGVVHIRGMVKGGTIGQTMFKLSFTYCPWFYQAFPAISNNALARVTVQFVTPTCAVYADFGSTPGSRWPGSRIRNGHWPLAPSPASHPLRVATRRRAHRSAPRADGGQLT